MNKVIEKGLVLANQILIEKYLKILADKKTKCAKHGNSKVYLEIFDMDGIVNLLESFHKDLTKKSYAFAVKDEKDAISLDGEQK